MSSITASVTALRVLRAVDVELATTQRRIATGLRVALAKDNPSVWATAQALKSEIATTSALAPALSHMEMRADVASVAATAVQEGLEEIRRLLILASAPSANREAIDLQIRSQQDLIRTAVASAGTRGQNWLDSSFSDSGIAAVVGRAADGDAITVNLDLSGGDLAMIGNADPRDGYLSQGGDTTTSGQSVLDFRIGSATPATAAVGAMSIANITIDVDSRLKRVSKAVAALSGFSGGITRSRGFVEKVNDIRSAAVSRLVDADIEMEQARLRALEIRRELATTILSLANRDSANILALFR